MNRRRGLPSISCLIATAGHDLADGVLSPLSPPPAPYHARQIKYLAYFPAKWNELKMQKVAAARRTEEAAALSEPQCGQERLL